MQAGSEKALKYKSSLDGLRTIIKDEGISGLYKGIGSKLTQSVLTAAILFVMQKRIYEMTKKVRVYILQPLFFLPPSFLDSYWGT